MKDKDRPSRIMGWLNGVVYVLLAVLAAAIVISMNFEAGVLQVFFLVFVAAVGAMTLWLKRQLSTLPETEDEVQPAGTEAAALLEGARAVLRYREFEPTARAIFDICKELTGATAGYVALMSADGTENEVLFLDAGGRACRVDPDLPMPIRGLRGEAYATGKTVYENDFGNSPWIKYIPLDHVKLDNILFAPLILEEKVVGVIGLANKPSPFNDDDARLAAAFGEIASIGLANSQMLESLEEREQTVSALVETSTDWIWAIDLEGVHTYSNPAVESILGYSSDELIGKPNFDLMHPEDKREIEKMLPEWTRQKEGWRNQLIRWKHKDGSYRYLESNAVPILDVDGRLTGFRGVDRDVTERKKAEEEHGKLLKAIETAKDGMSIVSPDGVMIYTNRAMDELFGYDRGELAGKNVEILNAGPTPEATADEIMSALVKNGSWEGEIWNKKKDGSEFLTYSAISGTVDSEGTILYFANIQRDITARKRAEEKIESLAKFPAENPNAVLRIRRDGAILYSNRAGLAMENAWSCRRGQRLEGQWLEMVEKALNLGAVQRGEIKYRGRVFSLVFAPIVESDYVNVYGLDITDLREAEAALYWESLVNKALANLSNILNKPHFSFEEISDFVLAHAKRLTGSKFGFAGYVDKETGYLVCPTMTKEVWKQCRIQG
ncbi:MAG: PAS domain S-box protein, partial [Planctomycetes bacterium]|nr:PAS domain S-box protein [Planctomycetota bacterium]